MSFMNVSTYRFLVIEDNASQLFLIQEALLEAGLGLTIKLHCATTGEEACSYLQEADNSSTRSIDLILTDLSLPKMSGKEVLQFLKSNDKLSHIPVIVLTNSSRPEDVTECYDMGADGYMRKPDDFMQLVDFFLSIKKSLEGSNAITLRSIEKNYEDLKVIAA